MRVMKLFAKNLMEYITLRLGSISDVEQWYVSHNYFIVLLRRQHVSTYTGCPRRNVPDFGRVFLMLKYTDITQNTYVQI